MTVVERHVRTLRVRAPDEDRARHAAIVIEDALRTASIPGASSARVVVIRRLDIGAVSSGASPATVSLAIESSFHRLTADAVHGESPSAADAPVVYFSDDGEAVLALARRVARGKPPGGWFWPLLVPGWHAALPLERQAMLLVERAGATAAGVLNAAAVVETFAAYDALEGLLGPMREADAERLLTAIGWVSDVPSQRLYAGPARSDDDVSRRARRTIAHWVERWNARAGDSRSVWLTAMLLIAERPSHAASSALAARVGAVLEAIESSRAQGSELVAPHALREARGEELAADEEKWWEWQRRTRVESVFGGGPPRPKSEAGASPSTAPLRRDEPNVGIRGSAPAWDRPRATSYAGLLFLIPILSRLGIGDLLAERADLVSDEWPARVILRLAGRFGIPRDDPSIDWLMVDGLDIAPSNRRLTAAWIRAVRARCRRDTMRGLAALARRDGAVAVTRTHLDVIFSYAQTDIDVRRAGIDLDPGWVPWLGRVVQFHYVERLPDDTP
jgi:hypothetical protein